MAKKRQEISQTGMRNDTKEKIFLVAFLVFAIVVIILLFRNPTGSTILGAKLDKPVFDPDEKYLTGNLSVQLQEGDHLPTNMKVAIMVTRDEPPCQTHWICPNGKPVRYKEDNCSLIHADPDSLCCSVYPAACIQLIKDSDFEASNYEGELPPEWWSVPRTAEADGYVSVSEEIIDEETEEESSAVLIIENSDVGTDIAVRQSQDFIVGEEVEAEDPTKLKCEDYGGTCEEACWGIEESPLKCASGVCCGADTCTPAGGICDYTPPGITAMAIAPWTEDPTKYCPTVGQKCWILPPKRKLSWKLWYYTDTGCGFEIVIKGRSKEGQIRNLHYYYDLDYCEMPLSNETDHYIEMEIPSMGWDESQGWSIFTTNLLSDWTAQDWSKDDSIKEIRIASHGFHDEILDESYGQTVKFDYIKFFTGDELSKKCTERGKECCLEEGVGEGKYLGEQLECDEGYACWEKDCLEKTLTLSSFKSASSTPTKYNKTKTVSPYTCVGCTNLIADKYLGGEGKGYTACSDTSSTSPKTSCRNWDNTYYYDLFKAKLKAPSENGTYFLTVQFRYAPPTMNETIFYETSTQFSVGVPYYPECEPNWVNCTNATICSAATNYTEFKVNKCTDANNCGIAYNESLAYLGLGVRTNWGLTGGTCEPEISACTADDYDLFEDEWCDDWAPSPCMPNETQTRICEADPLVCNDTAPGAEQPVEKQDCTIDVIVEYATEQRTAGRSRSSVERELMDLRWSSSEIRIVLDKVYGPEERANWWIWVLLIVIIAAAVILFLRIRMKKPKAKAKKAAVPPELLSYIKDAVAAGATKSEIAARLVQAGWPRESVDAALKSIK